VERNHKSGQNPPRVVAPIEEEEEEEEEEGISLAFITRIYHDARSSECQIRQFLLVHRTAFISAFLLSICPSATLFSHNIYRIRFHAPCIDTGVTRSSRVL
jgi:hypothetical protein